jgi:hypothetical protein
MKKLIIIPLCALLTVPCYFINAAPDSIPTRMRLLPLGASAETQRGDLQAGGAGRRRPQVGATLRGRVTDDVGDVIVGATVVLVDSNGREKVTATNGEGRYVFSGLAPGAYTLRVSALGFAGYERKAVEVAPSLLEPLNIKLSVFLKDEVTIGSEAALSTDPESDASALILRGRDLNVLPDNPESLAAFLQAMAGTSAGIGGGQIVVDGFTRGRLPPKDSIREIRINRNSYSAEFDRPGNGRIEVFTKPGTSKIHGGVFASFNDESLNTRNPFAPARAPFQSRFFGGNLSGPLAGKRASYFINVSRYETDSNAVINATVLDPALNIVRLNQALLVPQHSTTFTPRIDFQLNKTHSLVGRYTYSRSRSKNAGIGEFSLLSRAYNSSNTEHSLQLSETAILSTKMINEMRFQYARRLRRQDGDNSVPTISVLDAFTGGGAQVGRSFTNEDVITFHNYTTKMLGGQTIRFGGQLRGIRVENNSPANFGGTYTFAGGLAPQLGANNTVVRDANGQPVLVPVTSIERYRRTLLFQRQGLTPAEIRALGGGATQFSIAGGNPRATVSQTEISAFVQDDWRVRTNLTLSAGLRYEVQTNISSKLNYAPRLSLAWSPGASKTRQPKVVIRGGFGIFYNRFGEDFTLQARRFNGVNQLRFIVTDVEILDLYPVVPSVTSLTAFAVPQTIRRVSDDLRSPYTIQSSVSVERQLPRNTTLSATFTSMRTLHVLRSRNINAPLPRTFIPGVRNSGVRPYGNVGNIFEFESGGVLNQKQLTVNASNRFDSRFTLFATYVLNKAESNTDGAGTFPANTFDLSTEYGRSALDIRHQFYVGGSISAPYGISLNPFIIVHSGIPFNITSGRDTNGDTIFSERPALAMDLNKPGVVVTRFGVFDPNPDPTQVIIPRNYGEGPGFVTVNLFLSKEFSLGGGSARGRALASSTGGQRAGARPSSETPYKMTLSLQVQNLLNHTNLGMPIGNLTSPFFGQSLWSAGDSGFGGSNPAGNRRIEAQLRFSF